jgi:coenzyme F420 hydrogenase subunit beta
MGVAPPGYARPVQHRPLGARAEDIIAGACPGVIVQGWDAGPRVHPYWGPYRSISTGHAVDPSLRFRASSGGALTALVVHALRIALVDRVIHVSSDPDQPTRNRIAVSETEAEVVAGAGSRYSASSPMEVIEGQLRQGGRFAFIGKPCDVSALRRLAVLDDRVARHATLALSFFCAGVPSHAAAGRLLDAMDVAPDELVAFRYRGYGWPGAATAALRDGSQRQMDYDESWGGVLSKEVQFRCKVCPDAVGGVADVACADAWYEDDGGYPSFEESDGRSLIMGRTAVGQALIESAATAAEIALEALGVDDIERMQPSQARRKRLVRARRLALAATFQASPVDAGTCVIEASKKAGLGERVHNFLGMVRRVLDGNR